LINEIKDSDGDASIYLLRMIIEKTNLTFIMAKNLNKKKTSEFMN